MKIDSSVSAIVTGGASGLGAATARALAAQGARVALFDMNGAQGPLLARELGGVFCSVDVTSEEQVDAAFQQARAAIGQERILINCAGINRAVKTASRDRESGAIKYFPLASFDAVVQVNLIGTFRCIARSAAGMLSLALDSGGERGVIINTASIAAEDGQIGQAAYAASKAGIVGMTLPIARDLMKEAIRINTIMPGIFNTPMMQNAPAAVRDSLAASIPFPARFGEPDEYAALALHLVTNSYFNGAHIRLDGAVRMGAR